MSSFLTSTLRITRTTLGRRLFGPILSKFPDNRECFFFLKKAGGWHFRNSWNIGYAPVGNLRTRRYFTKRTKDDEVRVLVAWEGWVDGRIVPSAQDYLVSRRNAFFFCVESQNFMSFDFPAPFTLVETAPAITETESDHDQEGTIGSTLPISNTNDDEPKTAGVKRKRSTTGVVGSAVVVVATIDSSHVFLIGEQIQLDYELAQNSISKQALPIYLDKLVNQYLAIILSVTFVLAFGEGLMLLVAF
ncbi:hypothetical protein ACFE04_010953 [Oxalis oulophora]